MRALLMATLLATGCGSGVSKHFFVQTDDGALLKVLVEGNLDSDVIIVVLHGGPVGSAHAYNSGSWAADLEDRYAMAYVDQRAQGASQGAIDTLAYDLDRAALDVEQVLGVLRGRFGADVDLYLLGHSWGGMLGTLTLVDTSAQRQVSGWIEAAGCHDSLREPTYVVDRMLDVGARETAMGNNVEEWLDITTFAYELKERGTFGGDDLLTLNRNGYRAEGLIDAIEWDVDLAAAIGRGFRNDARPLTQWWAGSIALNTLYDEADSASLTDRLPEIGVPSLFLYADYDFVCPTALGTDATERVSNSERALVRFERSGHSLMFNEPDLFVSEVGQFVERTR